MKTPRAFEVCSRWCTQEILVSTIFFGTLCTRRLHSRKSFTVNPTITTSTMLRAALPRQVDVVIIGGGIMVRAPSKISLSNSSVHDGSEDLESSTV